MIVGIHQPNYLPWLGYFRKLAHCDAFVFLDTVQFSKNGYQNRVKVKATDRGLWLTQPVQRKGGLSRITSDVLFSDDSWRRKHLATIRQFYSKAPYFGAFFQRLSELVWHPEEHLSDYNIRLIEGIAEIFSLRPHFVRASDIPAQSQDPSERLAELVAGVGGSVYLSGAGGREYMGLGPFESRGIEVRYCTAALPEYPQLGDGFVAGLSIIDYLLNCGNELEVHC